MKRIILSIVVAIGALATHAKPATYEIKIQNITKGQPITPTLAVAHARGFKIFELGQPASPGLAAQAQDGATDLIIDELKNNQRVGSYATSSGVVLPGQTDSFMLNASPRSLVSVSAMVARTNDALVAGRNLRLPRKSGASVNYYLSVYDAGAEANTESCDHIPAPPCNNPGQEPELAAEGFVHSHPGVFGINNLQVLRDTFGKFAAKVTITKK